MRYDFGTGKCDICGQHRRVGDHTRCSALRKERGKTPERTHKTRLDTRSVDYLARTLRDA
jgi:hypothetical protein